MAWTHMCGSTRALRSVVREEGRADPVREVRLIENIHWGVTRGRRRSLVLRRVTFVDWFAHHLHRLQGKDVQYNSVMMHC